MSLSKKELFDLFIQHVHSTRVYDQEIVDIGIDMAKECLRKKKPHKPYKHAKQVVCPMCSYHFEDTKDYDGTHLEPVEGFDVDGNIKQTETGIKFLSLSGGYGSCYDDTRMVSILTPDFEKRWKKMGGITVCDWCISDMIISGDTIVYYV